MRVTASLWTLVARPALRGAKTRERDPCTDQQACPLPLPLRRVRSVQLDMTRYLTEDHDRIAQRMNDVVIRRIYSAGLTLQVALGQLHDQPAAREICHALDELDHAIRDIRDIVFDLGPSAR